MENHGLAMSNDAYAERQIEDSCAEALPSSWQRVLHLRCEVGVELGIRGCRIGDVMALKPGSVLDTGWKVGRDLPLFVNQQPVAWVEFEVMSGHLAVRVTELADDPGDKGARQNTEATQEAAAA